MLTTLTLLAIAAEGNAFMPSLQTTSRPFPIQHRVLGGHLLPAPFKTEGCGSFERPLLGTCANFIATETICGSSSRMYV